MSCVVVTGASGLIGSEAVRHYAQRGMDVVGIDNDLRAYFFGPQASTRPMREELESSLGERYTHHDLDIRDTAGVDRLFARYGDSIALIVHAAAQPSHDWAAREPFVDFGVNATGTLNILEGARAHAPEAVIIFTSTNKVYGDRPNSLPLVQTEARFDLPEDHEYFGGIPESFPIDQSLHSLFGASKVAADVLVQEYGRYFGMRTACFRGGCLTGAGHQGAELHGFLAYLMKCTATGTPYRVFGYDGKQVRDNIHSSDLVNAFDAFFSEPRCGEVYNIGGGRASNCSMLEAIGLCEEIASRPLDWTYVPESRIGDHKWWVSDLSRFQSQYPNWELKYDIEGILRDIFDANRDRWGWSAVSR